MIIKEINELNKEIISEIKQLESICKENDKLKGDIYLGNDLNFNKDIKNLFLAYENEKLVSVLSLFIPTKNEAEVTAYTLPEYRRKGYSKALLTKAENELKKYFVKDFLFICEPQSVDGKNTIKSLESNYDFTEYLLKLNKDKTIANEDELISIKKADLNDVENVMKISMDAFGEAEEDAKNFALNTLKSEERELYVANLSGEPVGICSVKYDEEEIFIFGLAISPKFQGKGIGKNTILKLLDKLCEYKKDIFLEVESNNNVAFELYKKCGFEVETAFEYHRKNVI